MGWSKGNKWCKLHKEDRKFKCNNREIIVEVFWLEHKNSEYLSKRAFAFNKHGMFWNILFIDIEYIMLFPDLIVPQNVT